MLILRKQLSLKETVFPSVPIFTFIVLNLLIWNSFILETLPRSKQKKDDVDENLATITEAI